MCEFTDAEMQERLIELVFAGPRMEAFRRDLLGKDNNLTLQYVLKEGRKHEAAALSTQQLQNLYDSTHKIDQIKTQKHCGYCILYHKYRQCPAYKDTCKA